MASTEVETRQVEPPRASFSEPDGPTWLRRGDGVGRYMVLDLLGAGGMGRVYRAYDPELDRQVAVKLLRPGRGGRNAQQQLLEEARLTAKLTHPNVVVVHDTGTFGEHVFVAMELVEGETLREWLAGGDRPLNEVLRAFQDAGQGLAAAHAAGIVHLDFKPSNVVIGKDGRARVLDFGLATLAREESKSRPGAETSSTFRGTPAYMPPEQHIAEPTDARADVYAFGISLWQGVYGVLPFFGETHDALLAAKRGMEPMTPQDVSVPPWIQRILLACMAPDPKGRPADMHAVLAALHADPVVKRQRRLKLGVGALGLLGLGFAASTITQTPATPATPEAALCQGSTGAVAQVWNDEVRAAGRAAFESSGRPYAADTWTRMEASMDRFAADWAAGRDDACADTRVRHEESPEAMDLRLGCYGSKLDDASALLALMVDADAEVVDNAAEAAANLPDLGACEDIAALRGRLPEPEDPLAQAKLAEGRALLTQIRAQQLAGKLREASEGVAPALAIAREANYPPLVARLLIEKYRSRGREPGPARQSGLLEAAALARASGAPELEVEAWTELTWSAGIFEGDREFGDNAMTYANAVADSANIDADQRRDIAEVSAALLATSGRADQALGVQLELVAGLEQGGEAGIELVGALNNLGNIHSMRNDIAAAAPVYERVVAVARAELGDAHPTTLRARHNLSINLIERGAAEVAQPELEALLADKIEIYGPEHQAVASAHAMLGHANYRLGKLDAARLEVQAAIDAFRALQGPRGGSQVSALVYLAEIELKAGKLDAAQAAVEQAMDIGPEAMGEGNPRLSGMFGVAGILRLERGDAATAVRHLERSLELESLSGGPDVSVPEIRYQLARALVARGDAGDEAAAKTHLEKAMSQFEADAGAEADDYAAATQLATRLGLGPPAAASP